METFNAKLICIKDPLLFPGISLTKGAIYLLYLIGKERLNAGDFYHPPVVFDITEQEFEICNELLIPEGYELIRNF
jgi:hypothetical protein